MERQNGLYFFLLRLGASSASNSAYHGYPELWILRCILLTDTTPCLHRPQSLFLSLHKSLEMAKTIHKILVDDLIFAN
jgi:hypothetical protein